MYLFMSKCTYIYVRFKERDSVTCVLLWILPLVFLPSVGTLPCLCPLSPQTQVISLVCPGPRPLCPGAWVWVLGLPLTDYSCVILASH